jgi:hypothetical protein
MRSRRVILLRPSSSKYGRNRADAAGPTSAAHCQTQSDELAEDVGYNHLALVEADISRYKRVIDDALRSHTDARRNTEVAVAVQTLNRMLELGRPEYVRTV